MVGDLEVHVSDALCDVGARASLEGRSSAVQLVGQDTDRPQVQFVVVGRLIDDLRADVVDGPTEGFPGLGGVDRPAEV